MLRSLNEIVIREAKKKYGDELNPAILYRLQFELEFFDGQDIEDELLSLADTINKVKEQGHNVVSRNDTSNSLVLFFLGINNINPLSIHSYCPKCHSFYWGDKKGCKCDYCEEKLKTDGYDLPFELYMDSHKENKCIHLSSSFLFKHSKEICDLRITNYNRLAFLSGLSQEDIDKEPDNINKVIRCLNESYFAKNYKKKNLIFHNAYIGIDALYNPIFIKYVEKDSKITFSSLVSALSLMHSTGVYDANKNYLLDKRINSRDELYIALIRQHLSTDEALLMCRETRLHGDGHLSIDSENLLRRNNVDESFINFMKNIRYIYHKGASASELKIAIALAKKYLYEPAIYFSALFHVNKELMRKIPNGKDILELLPNNKNTEMEGIYLAIVDLIERGYDSIEVMRKLKEIYHY